MKKFFKILAGLLVILVSVAVVGSVLLRIFLPPEKAKALVLKQLTTQLHREVRLGTVSVSLLSGLSVSDLKVSEYPDFSKGTFLSSDQFSIRLSLPPLLFRKIIVRQLALRHPVITIVRYPDGKTYNFSSLIKPSTAPVSAAAAPAASAPAKKPAPATPEPSLALLVSNASLDNGVVHFVDHSRAAQSMDIDSINVKLGNVSLVSPISLQMSLKVKAKQKTDVALQLAAEANVLKGSLKIKNGSITSAGTRLTLAGQATALRSPKPTVDLVLNIQELNLSTLKPFVALPPELRVVGPLTGQLRVKGDQTAMDFETTADLSNAGVGYGALFQKPAKTALTVAAKGNLVNFQQVTVKDMKMSLETLQVSGFGNVQGLAAAQPTVAFHLETNPFRIEEVSRYLPGLLPKDVSLKGPTWLAMDLSGTTSLMHVAAKWRGTDLAIAKMNQFDKPAGVLLEASLIGDLANQQTLTMSSVVARLASLEAKGDGSYRIAGAGSFVLSLKTNAWKIQDLAALVPSLEPYQAAGVASVDLRASGSPTAPAVNGVLTLQNVSARYERSALTHIAGSITFTQQDAATPRLTGQLNGSDFTLKLIGHRLTTQPDLNVDATVSALDLDKLLPPVKNTPTASGPRAVIASEAKQSVVAPEMTDRHGPLVCSWEKVGGLAMTFSAFAFVAPAYAAAPPTSASALGPMKILAHLAVGNIKHEFYQAQNLDFHCNLTDVTPDLSRVSGTADLKQGAGKLQNLEKLAALSKGARIALLPLTTLQKIDKQGLLKSVGLPSLQSLTFSGIRGDYTLRSGTMDVQNFELLGQQLYLQAKGTVGLAGAQPLAMRVTMKLVAGLIGGSLGQIMRDESGRATLDYSVTGSVSDPHVRLEMQDVGRRAVQQLGSELLKGLGVGRPQQPSNANPQPDNAAPPPPAPNPISDLQNQLKNIFH
jgi:hypothetical protein